MNGGGRRRVALVAGVVAVLVSAALTAAGGFGGSAVATFAVLTAVAVCFAVLFLALVRPAAARAREAPGRWGGLALEAAALLLAGAVGGEAGSVILRLAGARADPTRVGLTGGAVMLAVRLAESGYAALRRRVREVELAGERARREALLAELKALRARTDPHFLFNALNTVASLIPEDPERAEAVVLRLAGFFRHAHAAAGAHSVTLGEELDAAAAYLEIQELRFGERLHWRIEAGEGVRKVRVLPFLVQPLVENAVVHGLDGADRVTVTVQARCEGNRVRVTVEDDGAGAAAAGRGGTGTALADLRRRLSLAHGEGAALQAGVRPEGGFRAVLTVPAAAGEGPCER